MTVTQNQSFRERIYSQYVNAANSPIAPDSLGGLKPRLPYLWKLTREHLPSNYDCSILEIGCGHGALLYVLGQAGYINIRGIDTSSEQVDAARRLGVSAVEQGDIFANLANTPDANVDVVIAFDIIEHFTKDELIPLVDHVYRVLKPGGRWIIHVPNAESPLFARVRYGDFTHELAFTRASLSQLLYASRFSKVNCYEDCPIPHGIKSAIRSVLWRMIRYILLGYIAIETGVLDRSAIFSQNLLAVSFKGEID